MDRQRGRCRAVRAGRAPSDRVNVIGTARLRRRRRHPPRDPVGFFWTGDEFVISTATTAPKVKTLAAHPDVALAIDAGDTPGGATSLSVRGRADVQIVDGVVPEYLAAGSR